jgi:hypothetical protein
MNDNDLAGTNITKPCIQVKHCDLTRVKHSHYKSECPVCKKGMLLIARNWDTLILEEFDRCILCGQQFQYTDIENLRQVEKSVSKK